MLGEIVMTLAAKIATGVAVPIITAVIVVEGLGKVLGNTWNGPQWLAARISSIKIDKLNGVRKEAVQEFIKNHGKTQLSIKVQNNKIVEVNGDAVEEAETQTSLIGTETVVPTQTEKPKEEAGDEDDERSAGDSEIDTLVEESATSVNSNTKVYKGWAAVSKWNRLATKMEIKKVKIL